MSDLKILYTREDCCNWRKVYCLISFSLALFLVESAAYHILIQLILQRYWIAIPLIFYVALKLAGRFINKLNTSAVSVELVSIMSLVMLFSSIKFHCFGDWVIKHFEYIAFFILLGFFINLAISKSKKTDAIEAIAAGNSIQLFNLFYLNTSKAHEIAMLIDNKIMKTIEREQVATELLKYNSSASFGGGNIATADMEYSQEDSTKKRVYENFDVKTTKSIMLRKIYETAQKNSPKNLKTGDLAIFKDIELQQTNIDDTVMILNVLQDSKIKNQANENLEVNLGKMIDKMLDDFSINYTFLYKTKGEDKTESEESYPYIIQLPYKAKSNFENGYQPSDLQLGKLSLIGIYRGVIDFSDKDSTSSKLLELMSSAYNQERQEKEEVGGMKLSIAGSGPSDFPLDFNHKKLHGKMHLVDVIAIIQELNFNRDE